MANNLVTTNIPKVQISGLTYNNIVQDVYNLIKDNKALRDNFIDFNSADAGRMLTELFAWITDQLAQRIDLIGNELFLDTVENKENMLRLLNLVGYKLPFSQCASITVSALLANPDTNTEDTLLITPGVDDGERITFSENSFKKIHHPASNKSFELISFDDSTKSYNYLEPISIFTKQPNENLRMFEGKTSAKNIVTNTFGYVRYLLNGPVIKNSIKIYYTEKTENGYVELKEVDNFFSREAQTSTVPVYKVSNSGNGVAAIEFPDRGAVSDDILLPIGSDITILYRIGGGSAGNISLNSLISINEVLINGGTKRSYITYNNTTAGTGGEDEIGIEEIRNSAPQEIRNRISAVTAEDYEYILKYDNSGIGDIKVYGENNIPEVTVENSDLISLYGYSKNPLDVWMFIIKENSLYNTDIPDITDYINDISFQILDLNERLNEVYQVNKADLNRVVETDSLEYNSSIIVNTEEINHAYKIESSAKVKKLLSNAPTGEITDYKITITKLPFGAHEGNIDPNNSNKDYLFDNTYTWTGTEKDYRRYLSFDPSGNVIPLYEDITASISVAREDGPITVGESPDETTFSFSIDDEPYSITISSETYSSLSEICYEINTGIAALFNEAFEGVRLVSDITDINALCRITTASGDITITPETGSPETFSFALNDDSYVDMVDIINAATGDLGSTSLGERGIICKLASTVYEGEDCYDLVIYSETTGFSVSSDTFDIISISSESIVKVDADEASIVSTTDFITYENGILSFLNPQGTGDLVIDNTPIFRNLFQLTIDDFYEGKFLCSGTKIITMDEEYNNYVIGMANKLDTLPELLYISGFWGSEDTIKLGEYYETITENTNLNISSDIKSLLKRGKIRNLYNTVFQETSRGQADTELLDEYNSDYIVKITKKKIEDETFHQIGVSEEPPTVVLYPSSIPTSVSSKYLYLRVDGTDLEVAEGYSWDDISIDTSSDEEPESTSTFTNYAVYENGYVKIKLHDFSSKPSFALAEALSFIFNDKISIVHLSSGINIQSSTSYYYSSLDFGLTSEDVMNGLFILDDYYQKEFFSSGMYVPLKKIDFLKFSLKPGIFQANRYITFSIKENSVDTGEDYEISTGTTINSFKNNIETVIGNKIYIQRNEIFLASREAGGSFELSVSGESQEDVENIKNMFYDFDNIDVTETDPGVEYSVSLEKQITGDYYIRKNEEDFELKVVNIDAFPVGDLYFHMIEDYREDHIISSDNLESMITYTDEFVWNNSVENKKMLCVNHIYKQPKFIPFDLELSISIYKNVGLNKLDIFRRAVERYIKDNFNIYTSKLGERVYKDEIAIVLRRDIPGIADVQVTYLGYDIYNRANDSSYLEPNFNEKLIIASKKESTEIETSSLTGDYIRYVTKPVHGLFVKMEYRR